MSDTQEQENIITDLIIEYAKDQSPETLSDLNDNFDTFLESKIGTSDVNASKVDAASKFATSTFAGMAENSRVASLDAQIAAMDASGGRGSAAYIALEAERNAAATAAAGHRADAAKYNDRYNLLDGKPVRAAQGLSTALGAAGKGEYAYDLYQLYKKDPQAAGKQAFKDLAVTLATETYGTHVGITVGVGIDLIYRGHPELNAYNALVEGGVIDKYGYRIPGRTPSLDDAKNELSPIIFDLDGDGIETLSKQQGIYFDHDGNCFEESTGWVGADDGLLVRDINGDGLIDSGAELFGNNTRLKNGHLATNGYDALKDLDDNKNGQLDSGDAIWQQLRVWQDENSNGHVDSGELTALDQLNIKTIATKYSSSTFVDENGNAHRQTSTITFNDSTTAASSDVWFDTNTADTRYSGEYVLTEEILGMPFLKGSGNMVNLHIAMSRNDKLKTLVEQFIANPLDASKSNLLEDILFNWAGVENVSPTLRGDEFDARKVAFLEVITGDILSTDNLNGLPNRIAMLQKEYQEYYDFSLARLMIQTAYQDEFNLVTVEYKDDKISLNIDAFTQYLAQEEKTDVIHFYDVSYTFLNLLTYTTDFKNEVEQVSLSFSKYRRGTSGDELLINDGNKSEVYLFYVGHGQDKIHSYNNKQYGDVIRFVGSMATSANFDRSGNDLIINAYGTEDCVTLTDYFIESSSSTSNYRTSSFVFDDATLTVGDLAARGMTYTGTEANDTYSGWYGVDRMTGGAGNDSLSGGGGNDILEGGVGNDSLSGGSGTDILEGGAGNDYLNGGGDSDTYLFAAGHGQDTMYDFSTMKESDFLRFSGAKSDSAIFERDGNDLIIKAYGTEDSVRLSYYFMDEDRQSSVFRYSQFIFDDVTLTADDLATSGVISTGTEGIDSLLGWYGADRMTGGAGNDSLSGGSGTDILEGGAGNDYLNGGGDSDTYLFAAGHGQDTMYDFSTMKESDFLRFSGAKSDSAIFERDGNDLIIKAYGTEDSVRLSYYFMDDDRQSSVFRYSQFIFDDVTLTADDLATSGVISTGTEGIDSLLGWYGADRMTGGAGNDSLSGGSGTDILEGGAGNDYLNGGGDSDTYLFAAGHGQDTMYDFSSKKESNFLRFTGAKSDSAIFERDGNDLIIKAYGTEDSVRLSYYFSDDRQSSDFRYSQFIFDDVTLTADDLATSGVISTGNEGADRLSGWYGADRLIGGAGNDSLSGGSGTDVLNGGIGDDSLNGGSGQDTYLFSDGHGKDQVNDSALKSESPDILQFNDATFSDLWFSKKNANLMINEKNSEDSVELMNWFSATDYKNKVIHTADGYDLTSIQVQELIEAMSTFSATHSNLTLVEQQTEFMQSFNTSSYLSSDAINK
ncbi:MAG: hypothetical protein ACFWUG_07140 [Rahnella inusitata]|jgi:Ca2+-binding RTX toxin-like protein